MQSAGEIPLAINMKEYPVFDSYLNKKYIYCGKCLVCKKYKIRSWHPSMCVKKKGINWFGKRFIKFGNDNVYYEQSCRMAFRWFVLAWYDYLKNKIIHIF